MRMVRGCCMDALGALGALKRIETNLARRALVASIAAMMLLGAAQVFGQDAAQSGGGATTVEERPFSVALQPAFVLPLQGEDTLFRAGFGVSAGGMWDLPAVPALLLSANASVTRVPLNNETDAVLTNSLTAAAGLELGLGERLSLRALGGAGPFGAGLLADDAEFSMEWRACLWGSGGVSFRLLPALSLSFDAVYREFLGLYRDLNFSLGTAFHFGGGDGRARTPRERPVDRPQLMQKEELEIDEERVVLETEFGTLELAMDPLFPVFYSHYDDSPVGTATVTNTGRHSVEDVTVSFYIGQYMDNAKESNAVDEITSDESADIDIYGLFTNDILEITEGSKLSARFDLTYTLRGEEKSEEFIQTIDTHNRNALTWDDDRKICAFVTAKDPAIMRFARNVSGYIQSSTGRGMNQNLMSAMGLHEALDCYGMHYIKDPTTPYEQLSQQTHTIDYLLFPRQTLEYQGGDCDDLSAMYCALLESLGVETAFITIPGHIYVAFALDMSPEQARSTFKYPDELIFREGDSWVPVEVTLREEGFLAAWQQGAKQWREYNQVEQAGFYPVHQGWDTYTPVGLPGSANLNSLDSNEIVEEFSEELLAFVDREIAAEVASVQVRMDSQPRDPRWPNRLGIVYARYGVDAQAVKYFEQALELRSDYAPAMVNLGNIHYLQGNLFKALDYYEAAQSRAPDDPGVLLNIARANHDIENYGTARRAYSQLQEVSPSLANRFAYLGLRGEEAARAAQAGDVEGVILWSDEGGEE